MNTKSLAIIAAVVLFSGCTTFNASSSGAVDPRIEVFRARSQKAETKLMSLTQHPDLKVRDSAWRALANIPISAKDSLLEMALKDGSSVALFSLSTQQWTAEQLRGIEAIWVADKELRAPLIRILGIAGDLTTRNLIYRYLGSVIGEPWEAEFALALNRRFLVDAPTPDMVASIVEYAFLSSDPLVQRAWLYGMFRSQQTWINASQAQLFYSLWTENHGSMDPFIRQMLTNILAKSRHPELPKFMADRIQPRMSHVEQTELARAMFRYDSPDSTVLVRLLDQALSDGNTSLALDILNTAHTQPAAAALSIVLADRVAQHVRVPEPIEYAVMRIRGVKPTVIPENPALTGEYLALLGDPDEAIEAMKAHPDPIRAYLAQLRRPETMVPEVTDSALIIPPVDIVNRSPIWILETSEGRIVIELDGLRTPASTYAISKIASEGYYTGTFFHRVIQNFVIQAGLSFSGDRREPDFTVPTEAIEDHFERGSVGVASAGRDTEGGQFFIMHQWMPHLNGRYSNIGRVVEGMDVVDRVWQGTLIFSSQIVLP